MSDLVLFVCLGVKYTNGATWLRIQSTRRHSTYFQRYALRAMGYTFESRNKEWVRQADGTDLQSAQEFCKKYGFNLVIDLPQYRRSGNYREMFFETHLGVCNSDYYFCSYCGHLRNKKHITVDHLISVDAAQKSRFAKWIFKRIGIQNVNDPKNLVPACLRCNQRKGKKTGFWLIRGTIGRHRCFWFIFWPIIFFCLAGMVFILFHYLIPSLISTYQIQLTNL